MSVKRQSIAFDFSSLADLESSTKLNLPKSQQPLVFIMGLHRSGTTFLYESMADYYGAAKLTIQDIVYYPQLISRIQQAMALNDANTINEYFQSFGYNKRGNDNIELGPETAEEYGWILKRWGGQFTSNPETLTLLQEIVDKLSLIHSTKQAIMLKNPWDIGQGAFLAEAFPKAKFVFIKRSPSEILSSEINNALHFTRTKDPLLALLSNKIRVTKTLSGIFRLLRKVLSESGFTTLVSKLIVADITNNLEKYLTDIQSIPKHQLVEISYDDLFDKPAFIFDTLSKSLDLQPRLGAEVPLAKRAKKIVNPIVRIAAKKLEQRIANNGLSRFINSETVDDLK
jgi:hypothetical protein